MQCDPYEKRSVRSKRNWGEAAAHLGVHPAILREAYISRYFGPIQAKDFISIIMRKDDKKFVTMVKETCAAIKWTEAEIAEKEEKTQEAMEDSDFADLMNYRLKLLIEIGDEWLSDETKTYTFSDTQYLTKGKRYTIQTLRDEGGSEFGLTTTTDLPKETNYTSVHACKSIWRDGKEIWNWHRAYLALWLEQNPGHPQTQEMIDHCNGKADLVIGCT